MYSVLTFAAGGVVALGPPLSAGCFRPTDTYFAGTRRHEGIEIGNAIADELVSAVVARPASL
jgi:hypothetical protein